jgi:hypothetical protein
MKTKELVGVYELVIYKRDGLDEGGTPTEPKPNFIVQLSSNPTIGGTMAGDGTFPKHTLVSAFATPNAGYTFTNWTEGSTVLSENPSYSFTVFKDRTLVANFAPVIVTDQHFNVALSTDPILGGITEGDGQFLANASVTVNAVADAGYQFTNWIFDGVVVSTAPSYTFTLLKDSALVANFSLIDTTPPTDPAELLLTITSGGGSVQKSLDQPGYKAGDVVLLTAVPEDGFKFDSWSGDITSTDNPLSVTMDASKTISADFTLINPSLAKKK